MGKESSQQITGVALVILGEANTDYRLPGFEAPHTAP